MRNIALGLAHCAAAVCLLLPTAANATTTWQPSDLTTYTQVLFATNSTARSTIINSFNTVYASTFGVLEVGVPGLSGYSMRFDTGTAALLYLPANGTPAPLSADLFDPTTSSSGVFGGDLVALELNVDYGDAGLLPSSGFVFGDLVVGGTGDAAFDGRTVRQLLASMNIALGGGPAIDTYANLDALAQNLNFAFAGGTPSAFAQGHLSVASAASAVPEPWSWTMMVTGFAALGLALRRKPKRLFAIG